MRFEETYAKILQDILDNGSIKSPARAGQISTLSLFDKEIRIGKEFPILTGKKIATKNVISELCWILKGRSDILYLHKYNNHIWDKDAYRFFSNKSENSKKYTDITSWLNFVDSHTLSDKPDIYDFDIGSCGYIYGPIWRGIKHSKHCDSDQLLEDQLLERIVDLINEPFSRRHIVDAWSSLLLINKQQALPPCHMMFQCNVRKGENDEFTLDLSMWQRSCDMFLGVPFDLLSYGILHRILCNITGYSLGNFVWHGGDCHIYENHIEAVKEYLNRINSKNYPENKSYLTFNFNLDYLYNKNKNNLLGKEFNLSNFIFNTLNNNINPEDISIKNYEYLPPIKAELNVGI